MVHNRTSLKSDPVHGLDSRWSWITAGFCSWILFSSTLSNRVSGVLYYGIIETFQVTREEASWPVTLSSCFFSLAGPAMGYLCRRYSCRTVLMTCSFITGLGVIVCFVAPDLLFINIFFGIVHGVTMSGVFVGTNVVVAQHFQRRRTTACSVVFTACGLNTLVIPRLVEFFRSHYGIRGTFLLLGALIENAFPATIAIRSPPWALAANTRVSGSHKSKGKNIQGGTDQENCKNGPTISPLLTSSHPTTHCNTAGRPSTAPSAGNDFNLNVWTGSMESFSVPDTTTKRRSSVTSLRDTVRNFLKLSFFVDAFSFSVIIFGLTTFMLLSVDLAKDRGVVPSEAVYLLNAFCVGDITFRAVSGYVIDAGLVSMETVMLSGYLLQAAMFEALVWCDTLLLLLLCSALLGVSNGSRIGLQAPTLISDFGIEVLPMMIGGMTFVIGVVTLVRPVLIGHYRDVHGKYDGLLHIIACANFIFLAVWTLKLVALKRGCRNNCGIILKNKPSISASIT